MGKIKQFIESEKGRGILTFLVIILVGLGSFELGRLSRNASKAGIKIEYPSPMENIAETQPANAIASVKPTVVAPKTNNSTSIARKIFFASNRGSKYYSLGCSGGKTIKQENRVYFASAVEAEEAGYELSASCK